MKKGILGLFLVFMLTSFTNYRAKKVLKCDEQSGQMHVDGKTNDWKGSLAYDEKTGFYYNFSNDDSNLYVHLKMTNPMVQRKTIAMGFTLWIDPSGKGKEVLGIEYPKKRAPEDRKAEHHRQQAWRKGSAHESNPLKMIQKFNLRYSGGLEEGDLVGFDKAGLDAAFIGKGGIQVMLQINKHSQLIYEAKIPLSMIFSHPQDYLNASPKTFSLAFETGYLQLEMSRMNRGGGGMRGGRMGGGMRQGLSSDRMAAMQFMTSPTKIKWKKVVLNSIK